MTDDSLGELGLRMKELRAQRTMRIMFAALVASELTLWVTVLAIALLLNASSPGSG